MTDPTLSPDPDEPITALLRSASGGDAGAADELYAVIYDQLRLLARRYSRLERPGHTLQATDLVHEAYLKLVGRDGVEWKDRAHFIAAAGQAMRRILVDHARRRGRLRHGGGLVRLSLDQATTLGAPDQGPAVLALDEALGRLEAGHPEKARMVELHVFGGFTHEECARLLGVSRRTVCRHWEFAQLWLFREMSGRP